MKKPVKIIIQLFIICFFILLKINSQEINPAIKQEFNEYITQAEKYAKTGDLNEATRFYNKAGYLLWTNDAYKLAADYYLKALEYSEQLGNTNAIKLICSNLGLIYTDLEDYRSSLIYFYKGLEIKRKEGLNLDIASDLLNIANVLKSLNKIEEANEKLLESVEISQELNEIRLMKRAYGMLAENHELLGNSEKSFEYFNLFSSLDKLIKDQQIKESEKKTKEEIQKMEGITRKAISDKEATEEVLKTTEDSLKIVEKISREQQLKNDLLTKQIQLNDLIMKEKDARLKNIALTRIIFISISILLLAIAFILYRGYLQKKKSNTLLSEQNAKITKQSAEINKQNINIKNSINYAWRIQNALLPPINMLSNYIENSMIYFRPRDVVSGDFYWFSDTKLKSVLSKSKTKFYEKRMNNTAAEEFIIAAADCTGHGVPGALMSMIGYNLLHEIISHNINRPNEILEYLNKGIIAELKQDDKSEVQDGMDIALCNVNKKDKKIEFSGAKNPIVYIKNNKFYRIKGDNHSIGGQIFNEDKREFTNHIIEIDSPTTIYLFSDGYIDQLGGPENRKFYFSRFKKLLMDIYQLPFNQQSDILDNTILEWRKDKFSQLDDILIIGFKIE